MDAVTLAQVVDLLNKVGKNSDASGTNTLFARLAQIAAYVDQVEGYTDTVETTLGTVTTNVNTANTNINTTNTKIGTNADAAGTSTLFARLNQIAGFTDQVEGFVDTVESSLSSMTTTLNTINAKPSAVSPFGTTIYTMWNTTATGTGITALSLNGAGCLKWMTVFNSFGNGISNVIFIVDGVTINTGYTNPSNSWYFINPILGGMNTTGFPADISFKTSLVVQLNIGAGSTSARLQYELA